ncbi:MAG: MlaD family protein [Smithellaceae bacterium]
MSARGSKFLIGLFVVTGVTICAVAIIWVGASRIFMKGALYASYFDESVQGLQADSAIKYRGVDIGKVQSIRVAPDYRLIEVIMKIELDGPLQHHTVASLKTAGITGIVYIELDQAIPDEKSTSPALSFTPPYPTIPSRRSEISQFLGDARDIMKGIKAIDFAGISDQLKNTTLAIENFLEGKPMHNLMAHLESTAANLDSAVAGINKTIAAGKMDTALSETLALLSDARGLIAQAKKEMDALNLAGKSAQTDDLIGSLNQKTQAMANDLQDASEHLRMTSSNLQKLSESLTQNPSDLIFAPAPPPRKQME